MLRKGIVTIACTMLVSASTASSVCMGAGRIPAVVEPVVPVIYTLSFAADHVKRLRSFELLQAVIKNRTSALLASYGACADTVSAWDAGFLSYRPPYIPMSDVASVLAEEGNRAIPRIKAASAQSANEGVGCQVAKTGAHIITHQVAPGESLSAIASRYSVSVDSIVWASGITNPNKLKVGQVLRFPSVAGVIHQVGKGESVWSLAKKYGVSGNEIAAANGLADPDRLQLKQTLIIPGAKPLPKPRVQSQPVQVASRGSSSSRSASSGAGGLMWPVSGRITSSFGPRWGSKHTGIDIAVPRGTRVGAADDGRVIHAGWYGNYGILVIIDHGNGVQTYYGHNSSVTVSVGDRVQAGERIALSGNTGRSNGPHVHFEVRINGKPVDPALHLR